VNKYFSAKITEARVMKDLKNGGESKGYAFVAFETHEEALNALRKLVTIRSAVFSSFQFNTFKYVERIILATFFNSHRLRSLEYQ
jgi:RNA recognition motif-containing protein